MNNSFEIFTKQNIEWIDKHLKQLLERDQNLNPDLKEMMEYSIDAGGKRIRPLIMLAVLETLNSHVDEDVLTIAGAIEAIHTYSLIHDDLPAMDNDDLRRGKLTSHKKFGEAEAILTGDALLTLAFEWVTETNLSAELKNQILKEMTVAAGPSGMIDGQLLDIQGNQKQYSLDELQQLHRLKTGKMLELPATIALALSHADKRSTNLISDFMINFGLAFQIHDDIIDVTQSTEKLGKTAGKDLDLEKNTYVNLLGLENAKTELQKVLENCYQDLTDLSKSNDEIDTTILRGFLTYLK